MSSKLQGLTTPGFPLQCGDACSAFAHISATAGVWHVFCPLARRPTRPDSEELAKEGYAQNMTKSEAQARTWSRFKKSDVELPRERSPRGKQARTFRTVGIWRLTSDGTGACRGKAAMQSCASADGQAIAAVFEQGGQGDELRGLSRENPNGALANGSPRG